MEIWETLGLGASRNQPYAYKRRSIMILMCPLLMAIYPRPPGRLTGEPSVPDLQY